MNMSDVVSEKPHPRKNLQGWGTRKFKNAPPKREASSK
jgi:hypothetical protein